MQIAGQPSEVPVPGVLQRNLPVTMPDNFPELCVLQSRQAPLRLGNYLALDCTGGNKGALAFYVVRDSHKQEGCYTLLLSR